MKKLLLTYLLCLTGTYTFAQIGVKYDPTLQATTNLQYFRPKGDLYVGDVMPFAHNGTFYNYWLLDSAHHASLKGLGGHQWVLSTSTDLINWKQHPIVVGIDEEWEKSICTGSVVFYKGTFYAFYATRLVDKEGRVNEQLSYAISADGINFKKQKPNPFYTSAPGYSKRDFRDPKVFVDEKTGEFHLLVSSWQEGSVLAHQGGALVHMVSKDLKDWKVLDPILTGQPSVPECPDYFSWNGWWYLVYSDNSDTYYVKSRNPYGPWETPRHQALNESWSNVVKTAAFKNGRRIASSWVPSRRDDKDYNGETFGGNLLFREVTQDADGTLNTKFPAEMIPATQPVIPAKIITHPGATSDASGLTINAPNGVGAAHLENIPARCRITMEIEPMGRNEEYGFYLKSDPKADRGYKTTFSAENKTVSLGNTMIKAVDGLDKTVKIDLVINNDIIDMSIDGRRCIVNRTIEQKGDMVWFYAKHGRVKFKSINVQPLKDN
ncbi:family 43 glycosylhydrolase [Mucilaginibacter myungsuensis]|uniref:beta-fructofuranosidase n=1 Tax=Mucilaginibacter myungsuensis TaxID=649104 RepID=A0A929KYW6_9SPHI|nr:family 43 glycosylhydrolase [Mucilaginibacter myungsuensis]MBE9663717.1 family 43 glycosylhydrolase [Mucilaginibacter myungsuensis]MDN3598959.1 family 43 glycosylhydrolase [Mucilaginibacter myungsuensis]